MAKKKRTLSRKERREKRRRKEQYCYVFINGKQKRVKKPETIDGLSVDEYIYRNADPIWLHQNGYYDILHQRWLDEYGESDDNNDEGPEDPDDVKTTEGDCDD